MYLLLLYQVQICTYPLGTKLHLLPGTKMYHEQIPLNRYHYNRDQTITETSLVLNRTYPKINLLEVI